MPREFTTQPAFERYGFNTFMGSRKFKDLYHIAFHRALQLTATYDMVELIKELKGSLFEAVAFPYLRSTVANDDAIYSDNQTFQFYKKLFPKAEESHFPFGKSTLKGISVPDGLRFISDSDEVRCVYEYTLRRHDNGSMMADLLKKYQAFQLHKRLYPQHFTNAHLVFVVPNQFVLPKILQEKDDVGLIRLPFRYEEWMKFTQFVVTQYSFERPQVTSGREVQSEYGAPIFDIACNSIEQAKRGNIFAPELYGY